MPTVRRIPDPYPTLEAAAADAQSGDVILLAPGTYGHSAHITFPAVSFIGESGNITDTIIQCDSYGKRLYVHDADFNGTLLIEGININVKQDWQGMFNFKLGSTAVVHFNKVLRTGSRTQGCWTEFSNGSDKVVNLRMTYCSSPLVQYNTSIVPFNLDYSRDSTVQITNTYMAEDVTTLGTVPLDELAFHEHDVVTTTTAGYGHLEGAFLGVDYALTPTKRIAGVIDTPADPTAISVYRFRVHANDGLMLDAARIHPDAEGVWSFENLPTDIMYYIAVVPPEGYQPQLIGPYNPAD